MQYRKLTHMYVVLKRVMIHYLSFNHTAEIMMCERSRAGASRLAPIITIMHERLKAAQVSKGPVSAFPITWLTSPDDMRCGAPVTCSDRQWQLTGQQKGQNHVGGN